MVGVVNALVSWFNGGCGQCISILEQEDLMVGVVNALVSWTGDLMVGVVNAI